MTRERWMRCLKLAGGFILLIIISFILSHCFKQLINSLDLPLDRFALLAYLIVFAVTLVANLTVIAPVPIAIPITITVAQSWNPALTALAAALGGSIGELSGYFAGYAGRKITIANDFVKMERIEGWVNRWGSWAIALLAFQPIIPFDIGGIAAGAARMPLLKFILALFAGKLPKYLLIIYVGIGIINFLPNWWFLD
ncbi:MAG: VTT domain-containing protein [Dehalococcoidia bacterium]|nr:VTT domain-containing protein [Dehalococcoidia bacterium]